MTEIADGIYRIESDLGPRFMCQYVVAGPDRSVLVDTGLAETPAAVIDPYLSRAGLEPDFVLISHADNDHVGGNRAFRDAHPDALFMCHELDRRWVESNEALVRENYGWHAAYGFPPMDAGELLASMSGDSPVDVGLGGGETIRLAADRVVEVLHFPGTRWDTSASGTSEPDPRSSSTPFSPTASTTAPGTSWSRRGTTTCLPCDRRSRRWKLSEPELLLTAHYPVLERDEALEWLAIGRAFVDDVERVVPAAPAAERDDLWALTQRVDTALGPFPEFMTELGATVREAAH